MNSPVLAAAKDHRRYPTSPLPPARGTQTLACAQVAPPPPARIMRLEDLPDILTPDEVCAVLRKQVEKPCKAVRALQRGGLRVLKVGRDLRVMRADLAAFLEAIPR